MTTERPLQNGPPQNRSLLFRLPFIKNLRIGRKLALGFGILVILSFLIVGFSYLGSSSASVKIDTTADLRAPAALTSAEAQANLLRMLADVRGYLALGDQLYRTGYNENKAAFAANLEKLETLSSNFDPENKARLGVLQATFAEWSGKPETLFALRDDQLEREPAYRTLATDGALLAGNILIDMNSMIESQTQREATPENLELLGDMAQFQGTFASLFSALRSYATTRNRIYRQEYEGNLTANDFAWERLLDKQNLLSANQRAKLSQIEQNRQEFLLLPDQIFEVLESEQWRQDLYLFTTETVPLAERMQQLLSDLTLDQQTNLQTDLGQGRQSLKTTIRSTATVGGIALLLGLALALIFYEVIAGPIRRLTQITERIRGGDLEAQASIEANDEIGTLAMTFNSMTAQLRQTLFQVRKEKKRADDLLNVVIPIGVELSSEKDFNRLLENMLMEAKSFCHANGGILLLRPGHTEHLEFVILRNTAQEIVLGGTTGQGIPFAPIPLIDENGQPYHRNVATHAALSGVSINIANTANSNAYDFPDLQHDDDKIGPQAATSILTIPLKNTHSEVLGVMQLLDARDPDTGQVIPFDPNLQQMMESFSSLAAAALEAYIREQSLRQEIRQLRIEIDEVKRHQEVQEIVETDFFQDLQKKAQSIRRRGRRRSGRDESDASNDD